MLRAVLDTSILASAIVFGGKPRAILQEAIKDRFQLVSSIDLQEELTGVLKGRRFQFSEEQAEAVRAEIENLADVVLSSQHFHVITADPAENKVLECAANGKANVIVSGDGHLLKLQQFQQIPICPQTNV